MVWIDYTIIVVISFSCLIGLIRGFMREALSLITWGCAFFVSIHYYNCLSKLFTGFKNEFVRNAIEIALLFITTLIIGTVVSFVISQLIEKVDLLGIDKILGISFGALLGVVIIAVVLFFLDSFTEFSKSEDWKKSNLIPQIIFIVRWFFDYLQSSSNFYLYSKIF